LGFPAEFGLPEQNREKREIWKQEGWGNGEEGSRLPEGHRSSGAERPLRLEAL
jgi:hypothetical protein